MSRPAEAARRRLRVLALPAYKRRKQNPFQALLYDELAGLDVEVEEWSFWRAAWRRCDLWHLHHPDTVVYPRARWQAAAETVMLYILLVLARLRGVKVLWTVHDLRSHDGRHPALERWFWSYFPPRVDAIAALTRDGLARVRARYPALAPTPGHVTPHGDFRAVYPNTVDRGEARARLGLEPDRPVILHYGLIRPYKSVPQLISAFGAMDRPDATLLVAGRVVDPELAAGIRALAARDPRVQLRLDWIPFEETQLYFNACDLVALPYRDILNSGTALLGLSFERPVLVPDKGAMREQQAHFSDGWIRLFEGEISAPALSDALDWAQGPRRGPVNWTGLDWPSIARATRTVYDSMLTGPTATSALYTADPDRA